MHVLGHGFGQRRKSGHRNPRELHIRKISFSGSSLSDGSSSAASTPTGRSPQETGQLNPLHLHPAYQAPPRLYERPYIVRAPSSSAIVDDETDEEELPVEQHVYTQEYPDYDNISPTDCSHPNDYFFAAAAPSKRPALPRSRWSESTIATLDQTDEEEEEEEEEDSDDTASANEEDDSTPQPQPQDEAEENSDDETGDEGDYLTMRKFTRRTSNTALQTLSLNLSYTRPGVAPRRPPMRSLDSVDNFIRRGGWKRRGIVFRAEDMETRFEDNKGNCLAA